MGRRCSRRPTTSRRSSNSEVTGTVRGENSTMLKRVDRIQIAVADSNAAERVVAEVFGAELIGRDKAAPLGARRITMQAGASFVEILEPDGAGAVQDFVSKWETGLFGAGFSVDDPDAAAHHLAKCGVSFEQSAGQLYLDAAATFGMRTVISQHRERAPVGAIKWAYEVTNVVGDWQAASARYARIFGLDAAKFNPIESKDYGYTGVLTLFDPPARLDIADHRRQPCDGPFSQTARRLAVHVFRRDRRRRRARKAPAGARRAFRGASPRPGGAGGIVHPSFGISRRAGRGQPHRSCVVVVRGSRACAARRDSGCFAIAVVGCCS